VGGADPVVVIGGANSAAQAATALAAAGHHVTMVVHAREIAAAMVHYLVDRVEHEPLIDVATESEVVDVTGDQALTGVTVEHHGNAVRTHIPARAMFILIGAAPNTDWLGARVRLDEAGYILTGSALGPDAPHDEPWLTLRRGPYPLETSVPGVFAAGDIRTDSIKRVGSAVGDGSLAARLVHEWLDRPHVQLTGIRADPHSCGLNGGLAHAFDPSARRDRGSRSANPEPVSAVEIDGIGRTLWVSA
jgi:thioredoxin reductase (NADPH)